MNQINEWTHEKNNVTVHNSKITLLSAISASLQHVRVIFVVTKLQPGFFAGTAAVTVLVIWTKQSKTYPSGRSATGSNNKNWNA